MYITIHLRPLYIFEIGLSALRFKGELRDKNELIYNSSPISKLSVFNKLSYRTPTAK